MKFEELGLSNKILKTLEEMNFTSPTEIQEKAIPLALEGRDIIGSSATGSGKTLAFSLGVIEKLKKGEGPQFLILTPTRELADQINKVLKKVTEPYGLKVTEVYGGVSISNQIDKIPKSEIIVGTPGRILDHLERKTFDTFNIKFLVLDEADRMADMGFLPDVEKIIRNLPIKRQTMLFSATLTPDINFIAKKYMNNPENISAIQHVDPSKLTQIYYDVQRNMKFSLLVHLLKQEKSKLIMIFCNTRMNSDFLARNLKRYNFDAMAIHGGLDQKKRNRLMEEFHGGDIHILVCTDVAARGLDVKGISHVYNYDIPTKSDDYIHRIGRTARAGKEGMAISIVTDKDYDNFARVLRNPEIKIERKETPYMEKLSPNFQKQAYRKDKGFRRTFQDRGSRSGRDYGKKPNRRDNSRSFGRRPSSGRDNSRFSRRRH